MDRRNKPGVLIKKPKNILYMDLRDIIQEHALRYLPAKSLHRFKAVSRDWKHRVSTPFFAHSQSYFFNSLSGLFCKTVDGALSYISVDPMAFSVPDPELKFLPEPVDLLASNNGLLCCRGRSKDESYYVCNPVNKEWRKLPKPTAEHGSKPNVVLVFEPSLLNFVTEFKLVCAFRSADIDGAYEFEIYSSIENSWKISPEIFFAEREKVLRQGGVYVNGVVYWTANRSYIVGFDLKKNRSTSMTAPAYNRYVDSSALSVLDGKLCVSDKRSSSLMVWQLSNVQGETRWVQLALVLKQADFSFHGDDNQQSVLAVGNNDIVFHYRNSIFSCNKKTLEIKTLIPDASGFTGPYLPYVNSLVFL